MTDFIFERTIEAITATCRQRFSQGRLERLEDRIWNVRAHFMDEVSDLYSDISEAIKHFMVSRVGNNN